MPPHGQARCLLLMMVLTPGQLFSRKIIPGYLAIRLWVMFNK